MAFIQTTAPEEAEGDVRAMYERQQTKLGYVPNYAKVFCHRPGLMGLWANLLVGIRRHVDTRRFALVTLAAAHALRNSYCSLAHAKMLTEFFRAEEIQAIASGGEAGALSAAEAAMVRFARTVARDASAVTAGDVAALHEHGFTDAEIFDIVSIVAGRAFLSTLVDGLGAEPDATYLDMDEALRRSLTVGRPIASHAPERIGEPCESS